MITEQWSICVMLNGAIRFEQGSGNRSSVMFDLAWPNGERGYRRSESSDKIPSHTTSPLVGGGRRRAKRVDGWGVLSCYKRSPPTRRASSLRDDVRRPPPRGGRRKPGFRCCDYLPDGRSYSILMAAASILEREEYVEQAYFFRIFRERVADNMPAQEILERLHEEVLSSTRLPYAIQFLGAELKHSGLLANGFSKLPHYFTEFQAYAVRQAEDEKQKFAMPTALLVLEREAAYKAENPTAAGLYVYQFEAIARNRLGYMDGLVAMAADPHYDAEWSHYIDIVRRQVGVIDFGDLLYLRSELYARDQQRQ